jgi:hypothetical protein
LRSKIENFKAAKQHKKELVISYTRQSSNKFSLTLIWRQLISMLIFISLFHQNITDNQQIPDQSVFFPVFFKKARNEKSFPVTNKSVLFIETIWLLKHR